MLIDNGVATDKELKLKLPSLARFDQGPVAVFECFQEIPCNPCESSCYRGAVSIGNDINAIPQIDYEVCNGCANCVGACPGLAIFVIDNSGKLGRLTIPYEFVPVPVEGDTVLGLDRSGIPVAECNVVRVVKNKKLDKTVLITLELEKEKTNVVRFIKVKG